MTFLFLSQALRKHLLCAKQCSDCFAHVNSFDFHKNPLYALFHFVRKLRHQDVEELVHGHS